MPVTLTGIDGLLVVERETIHDSRGVFRETYRRSELEEALGRPVRFGQNNHSRSAAGVLRGFHLEPWDKFVYVPHGTAFVAVLDARPGSRTYGRVETLTIGDPPGKPARVFIPRGLANAFEALTEVDYLNDVSEEYTPYGRAGVAWDDPDLGVAWPITPPVLSDADRDWPRLRDLAPTSA
jgi:dTDP-4-dehydrorhamnose 3,5-epimerase